MKCCVCKEREATVHLTQIAGDKMQKLDLCEECSKKKGVSDSTGLALADLLLGLGASQEMEQVAAAEGRELKCPHCGFTQADFKKAGRLGCPDCYETFSEPLGSLLKTMHKGTRHVGKRRVAVPALDEQVARCPDDRPARLVGLGTASRGVVRPSLDTFRDTFLDTLP